ncbi:MAG: regulatory protein RecX [Candidatus Thiodubiliella endoseptemdiera]|uniref:Regulatory protein RecX n=2 Tax=Candidatus Thiodubiliella endoseptemdiera TaxID=2738886 RepID=A0A853F6Z9_9GAMM|nr:regulatory protein RecX [Candidatus Thiodubiliella endoseptemdiera]
MKRKRKPNQRLTLKTLSRTAYNSAMEMLVKREHSYVELYKKLIQWHEDDEVTLALEKLKKENYQSDERFTNEFIQMRFNQGKGPIKIAMDLRQRGIEHFDLSEHDFFALAKNIRIRKYGEEAPSNYKEKSKQQRFLQSRGFDFEQINHSF